ncbi:spore protease YyaC [Thermohalobacter berrensis]|uniref:Spore protease YyaC n=1 Tax=Thermohalobacter berrensis TaxID=99594 RepID=A0A419T2K8_9FIRM|nr:spore protease YyaC [Thermohalobacter berrensis]RKD31673.1 spore protease YyaC [Thermohalobacter berrensis]
MSLLNKRKKHSVNSDSPFAISEFSNIVLEYLHNYYNENYDNLIIVCIGTDRSTGDSLGPLVGDKLSSFMKWYPNVHLLGTLNEPVHAKNLEDKIKLINCSFSNPFIISIDASLGKSERIGYVTISTGPLKPGAGVNKDLPEIGDIHITGIVNMGGFMEYVVLQNTRLSIVMKMANVISKSILFSLWKYYNGKENIL